jgi:glucose-1-phosphate thymidylyltransferase
LYLKNEALTVKLLGRGYALFDTGTIDSLFEASDFVKTIENIQNIKISSIEEIAYVNGWVNKESLIDSSKRYGKSSYGEHLRKVSENKIKY